MVYVCDSNGNVFELLIFSFDSDFNMETLQFYQNVIQYGNRQYQIIGILIIMLYMI